MADRTTFKQLHKEQSKVKISADFLVIIGMISIAAILVSIWIAFFLNFGKDAEVLKHEINKNSS